MLNINLYAFDFYDVGCESMFYNIKFLLKNLEGNEKVSNFALAFEKRPKRGSGISPEAEADGARREKIINKFFEEKFGS